MIEEMAELKADSELLGLFVQTRSEEAFAQIVRRHIDLVYSTALRRTNDPHLAEDVTQTVFFVLSKKAAGLGRSVVLAGWLYQTARFVSMGAMKMKMRREKHERVAAALRAESGGDETWTKISPVIEAAMDRLSNNDRNLILLKYFEEMEVAEIARIVGVSANTASKRLQRALERLRKSFGKSGVDAPVMAIGPAIVAGAVHSAPAGLVGACVAQIGGVVPTVAALAKGAMGSVWVKAVVGVAAALAVAGLATVAYRIVIMSPAVPPPPPALSSPIVTAKFTAPLTGPLDAASPQQLDQIRMAIYALRHYAIFIRDEDWPRSIRTLVQIGRPAVPELVAELDRTSDDSTLRAMGFTLRAIGDPRACPALIRAIARTNVYNSDCAFHIDDRELAAFMHQHELEPTGIMGANGRRNYDLITYDRAIREICGALETITHHKEGKPWAISADSDQPSELARAKLRHQAMGQRWQRWWNANHRSIVSDADLATLTAREHPLEDVLAAGAAANGPLFPTGKPYHLGEVHDIWMRGNDKGEIDTQDVVDFDAERKTTFLEALRAVPKMENSALGFSGVCQAAGIDARSQHFILNHPKSGQKDVYGLEGWEDQIWQVDDGEWDRLEGQIGRGETIPLEDVPLSSDFEWRERTVSAWSYAYDHFPATFLFRTAQNGAGIVQVLGSDIQKQAVHIRYRMVEPHPGTVATPALNALPAVSFGPTRTVVLSSIDAPGGRAINFASGALIAPPDDLKIVRQFLWMEKANADLAVIVSRSVSGERGLAYLGMLPAAAGISPGGFDSVEPGTVALACQYLTWGNQRYMLGDGNQPGLPSTAIFRTKAGVRGVIQVLGNSDTPGKWTIRYKLLIGPTTQGSAVSSGGAGR
jgi:RNA polymerase sigma factor (sigma-70 family)